MKKDFFDYIFYNTTLTAWDAMYQAILDAKNSIFWEVYILNADKVGERFVKALCDKANEGVKVKIIVDTIGSLHFSRVAERQLKNAGVQFFWYNRIYPEWRIDKWIRRVWFRNHRKVLLIDEHIAFVGGVNIDTASAEWDDIQLRIKGEVIKPLLRGFAKSFVQVGGDRREVRRFLHPRLLQGFQKIREHINVFFHSPSRFPLKTSRLRRFYLRSLRKAKKSFTLLTPYYVPDKRFLYLVRQAKKRGVQVSILLPLRPDHKLLEYMVQAFYDLTVEAGASVYLLPKMNHGKALSVDNTFGLVGSVNFTPRSFIANEESGIYFQDPHMVQDLNNLFDVWKKGAHRINEGDKSERKWHQKFLGWITGFLKDYV
jgi:cardiolipin synthase